MKHIEISECLSLVEKILTDPLTDPAPKADWPTKPNGLQTLITGGKNNFSKI